MNLKGLILLALAGAFLVAGCTIFAALNVSDGKAAERALREELDRMEAEGARQSTIDAAIRGHEQAKAAKPYIAFAFLAGGVLCAWVLARAAFRGAMRNPRLRPIAQPGRSRIYNPDLITRTAERRYRG